MIVSPYGSWASPITSDLVAGEAVRLDRVALDGDSVYWAETQPRKQGRTFVFRSVAGGEPELVTPDDDSRFSVRTRVHEYGGGAFAVDGGVVVFSNFADQRLYRQDPGRPPRPITPLPDSGEAAALRYADGAFDRRRGRMIFVREDHTGGGEPVNALVAIDLLGAAPPAVLVSGADFVSTPRISPDGSRLAWLVWSHPDMPWIATELWVADILPDGSAGAARRVAGGPGESVVQPEFSPDGDLVFVSDRSGWWNLHREHEGRIEPLAPMEAEFARPQWVFGMSSYAFESAERLICSFASDGAWSLASLDMRERRLDPIRTGLTEISQVRATTGSAAFLGGAPSEPLGLVALDLGDASLRMVRRSFELGGDIRPYLSAPEPIAYPTGAGETAHAIFYPPSSSAFAAPGDEKPPILVLSHGGPTASASSTLSLDVQFWTSRGVGVLDVNYRGSTGYGRDYRLKLERRWGVVDVEDCVHGARYLVERRNADPSRLMIAGGSAGGYTTLCALAAAGERTFAGGASHYGVSDLAALARDTHKFESRYLDWLIGPYPQEAGLYAERSPVNHADRISAPVIFFQGSEDRVVPPNQTELMVAALKERGIPVGYFLFEGESHGFRRAETIRRALEAELAFFATLVLRCGLRF
jgi:dipeptidyl aminopeptidase/acylaminoacyl peptidase